MHRSLPSGRILRLSSARRTCSEPDGGGTFGHWVIWYLVMGYWVNLVQGVCMRLTVPVLRATLLLVPGTLIAGPLLAQQAGGQDHFNLPVSVDRIKEALEAEPQIRQFSLRSLDEQPTFRVEILERQKIEE